MNDALNLLRELTRGTEYEGRLYLVGGIVRDKLLNRPSEEDIDIVLEGDANKLAEFLYEKGLADYPPVTYPRFGTAMVSIKGLQVELVGARKESYRPHSRKPSTEPGTLMDDAFRRDFTINTLMENLHTGQILDLTGLAMQDLKDGIIRTPKEPEATFRDDPLRMLRAIRFSARLGFDIDPKTYSGICNSASRIHIVSGERIREEFVKILMCQNATSGLEMLRETGLLANFAPELAAMHNVVQNKYHIYDVWTHSLKTLELIPLESGITLRMAALLHDVGKPKARTVDDEGNVHFYGHERIGARLAGKFMQRLKFSNSEIDEVEFLILMHMRVGEYENQWTDTAVRRLLRDAGDHLDGLIQLARADKQAANGRISKNNLDDLEARIRRIKSELNFKKIASPLNGREIMDILGLEPGPKIGEIKEYLENQVIEGRLAPDDKSRAIELIKLRFG